MKKKAHSFYMVTTNEEIASIQEELESIKALLSTLKVRLAAMVADCVESLDVSTSN